MLHLIISVDEVLQTTYCEIELDKAKRDAFVYAIKNHYWYQMYIDDLPIWGKWCYLSAFWYVGLVCVQTSLVFESSCSIFSFLSDFSCNEWHVERSLHLNGGEFKPVLIQGWAWSAEKPHYGSS